MLTRAAWAVAALACAAASVGVWGGTARPFAAAPAILAVAITGATLARWLTPLEPPCRRCPVCLGPVVVRHHRATCSPVCEATAITDGGI